MTETDQAYQIVTLQRADRAVDLWPAIEAAQYGHIVQRDDPDAPVPVPMHDFLTALFEIIEAWEETGAEGQAALIQKLEPRLAALEDTGDFVHWGAVQRTLVVPGGEEVEIPVAVLRLGAQEDSALEVAVPHTLTAEDDDPDE